VEFEDGVVSIERKSSLCKDKKLFFLPDTYSLLGSYHFIRRTSCGTNEDKIH
jgi:hypothetical protein